MLAADQQAAAAADGPTTLARANLPYYDVIGVLERVHTMLKIKKLKHDVKLNEYDYFERNARELIVSYCEEGARPLTFMEKLLHEFLRIFLLDFVKYKINISLLVGIILFNF